MTTKTIPAALERFIGDKAARSHPVPLVSTSFDVEIVSGLAVVKTTRMFRNVEARSIEATLTFPVPFDAAVTSIEAIVEGRRLTGVAKARSEARESYETAIDDGKSAVLHEELLRGLHMLSVGHVAPRGEIEVVTTFVTAMSVVGEEHVLRIPTTIGHVFGEVPLVESDGPEIRGTGHPASLRVETASGRALVEGRPVGAGTLVRTDAPVIVRVQGLKLGPVVGRAADGRVAKLTFAVEEASSDALDIDVLLDSSGSMKSPVGGSGGRSKWAAMLDGCRSAFAGLGEGDAVRGWSFSGVCTPFGSVKGSDAVGLLARAPMHNGGTHLSDALRHVAGSRSNPHILLVTDGLAWNGIDVLGLGEARLTAVLVGAGALEASIGHAVANSGGRLFVSDGDDLDQVLTQAVASMRAQEVRPTPITTASPSMHSRTLGVLRLDAKWAKAGKDAPERTDLASHVAAFAAHLALPAMTRSTAKKLAEAEGLVSEHTSIVLVDEAGEVRSELPAHRKVALPDAMSIGTVNAMRSMSFGSASLALSGESAAAAFMSVEPTSKLSGWADLSPAMETMPTPYRDTAGGHFHRFPIRLPDVGPFREPDFDRLASWVVERSPVRNVGDGFERLAALIDWDVLDGGLIDDPALVLDAAVVRLIALLVSDPRTRSEVERSGATAREAVIAIAARLASTRSRTAARLRRKYDQRQGKKAA